MGSKIPAYVQLMSNLCPAYVQLMSELDINCSSIAYKLYSGLTKMDNIKAES